jgi:hypothetical protein
MSMVVSPSDASHLATGHADTIACVINVGGYVWPLGEPAVEAARQVELRNRNLCTLANNFSDAGSHTRH